MWPLMNVFCETVLWTTAISETFFDLLLSNTTQSTSALSFIPSHSFAPFPPFGGTNTANRFKLPPNRLLGIKSHCNIFATVSLVIFTITSFLSVCFFFLLSELQNLNKTAWNKPIKIYDKWRALPWNHNYQTND